jgi:adenine deaminase
MKPSLRSSKKRANDVFSQYIRQKYKDKNDQVQCVTCKTKKHWKEMQAGHFIPGRRNAILFVEDGVYPQCYVCNVLKSGNLIEYYPFMIREVGIKRINELKRLGKQTLQMKISDYQEIESKFRQKLKSLQLKDLQ